MISMVNDFPEPISYVISYVYILLLEICGILTIFLQVSIDRNVISKMLTQVKSLIVIRLISSQHLLMFVHFPVFSIFITTHFTS